MESTIHLRKNDEGTASIAAACTEHYTSIDLQEPGKPGRLPDVVAFVDAGSALALAYAAVEAYQYLTGKGITEAVSDIVGCHNDKVIEGLTGLKAEVLA